MGLLTFHPDPTHPTLFSSTASDTSIKVCVFPELTSSEGTWPHRDISAYIGCSSNTYTHSNAVLHRYKANVCSSIYQQLYIRLRLYYTLCKYMCIAHCVAKVVVEEEKKGNLDPAHHTCKLSTNKHKMNRTLGCTGIGKVMSNCHLGDYNTLHVSILSSQMHVHCMYVLSFTCGVKCPRKTV